MKQQTVSDIEYSNRKRITKREEFLDAMNGIVEWKQLEQIIKLYYFNNKRGRPPKGIEKNAENVFSANLGLIKTLFCITKRKLELL